MYNISDQCLHKVDLTSAKWQKKCGLFSESFTWRSILCHLGNSSKQKGVQSAAWVIMPTEREVIKRKRSTGLYLPVEIKRTTAAASWEPWFNSGDAQSQQPPLSAFIKPGMFSHTANWLLDEALQTALYSAPFDFYMSGALKECSTEGKSETCVGGKMAHAGYGARQRAWTCSLSGKKSALKSDSRHSHCVVMSRCCMLSVGSTDSRGKCQTIIWV